MKKSIAFVTSSEDPDLISDDRLVIPLLQSHGVTVSPLVWDQCPPEKCKEYSALIFRSCWNYHRRYKDFLLWLEGVKRSQVPVFNSLPVILWNLNKAHILEIGQSVVVPKTKWLKAGEGIRAQDLVRISVDWKVEWLVIKPAVSLNGHDTHLLSIEHSESMAKIASEISRTRDVLIQEYIPEIKTEGEVSLVFFNNIFSHAIRKRAAAHEFRIHGEYGGTREATVASSQALAYSQRILSLIPEPLLYARVDLVETGQGPRLIELEVTDPMLYLGHNIGAPARFAEAILRRLSLRGDTSF